MRKSFRADLWRRMIDRSPTVWLCRLLFTLGAAIVALAALFLAWISFRATYAIADFTRGRLWIIFLISPLGLALCAFLTRTVFPGSQGSGIPQAMASLHMDEPRHINTVLSLRIMFGKMLLMVLGYLSGATIGREGPTVQVGASIMNSLTRFKIMRGKDMQRVLVLIGGAAGIAGAFNTPIAGVIFAIEELGHSFDSRHTAALLGAVVTGGIATLLFASHFYMGGYNYFGTVHAAIPLGAGYAAVALCGVVGGIMGGFFGRILALAPEGFPGFMRRLALRRPVLFAGCCGLVVAFCDFASKGTTFGSGYLPARALLHGHLVVGPAFALLKYIAMIASYLSGIPGGIFSPALGIGAGIGSWFTGLVPGVSLPALAVLGMAGYFAGAVQTPITAVVIVLEMTNNQSMIVPVTATALLAFFVSRRICPRPVYSALADKFLTAIEPGRVSPEAAKLPHPGGAI
ncbi:MAG: chloride channel protein [Acetobacteraceae bacterium]